MSLVFNTVPLVQHLLGPGRPSLPALSETSRCSARPPGQRAVGAARENPHRQLRSGGRAREGLLRRGPMAARFCRGIPFLRRLLASQVLQGGGLESPTKPKGRPKKNSIPSSEQLSEQERARDAEKPPESLGSPAEVSQEE